MNSEEKAAMTWDSIEKIKNREILEIVACTNKDEEAVMLVTVENE